MFTLSHPEQPSIATEAIPAPLRERRQWVVWRLVPRDNGRTGKLPLSARTLRAASPTNPETWSTFADARAVVEAGHAAGTGYVFAPDDPFFGIDLDDCRDPKSGEIEPRATGIIDRLNTFAEASPSGTGVHIIGYGALPKGGNRRDGIEVYDTARYFTVTSNVLPGFSALRDCSEVLPHWHAETFGAAPLSPFVSAATPGDVLARLRMEQSGVPAALLRGDWSSYKSPSEARWALANRALFYGADAEAVRLILLTSDLFASTDPGDERERRAGYDASKAAAIYAGPRYDPKRTKRVAAPIPTPCATSGTAVPILANGELKWTRLSAFALVTDLATRIANGEQPEPAGYRIPAARYAEMTGQSERTVAGHLRDLAKRGLISKSLVRIRTQRTDVLEIIDGSTGELTNERETVRGTRDANYLHLPAGGLGELIAHLVAYPASPVDAGSGASEAGQQVTGEGGADAVSGSASSVHASRGSGRYNVPHTPVLNTVGPTHPKNLCSHAPEVPESRRTSRAEYR